MKLRFRNNSLRFRVNRSEVQGLASGAVLREQIHFPGDSRICYTLEASRTSAEASFREGVIRIAAPERQVNEWAHGDAIGMYFDFQANGRSLRVAIEKDLECLDGPEEERDADAFPRSLGNNC